MWLFLVVLLLFIIIIIISLEYKLMELCFALKGARRKIQGFLELQREEVFGEILSNIRPRPPPPQLSVFAGIIK